MPEEVAEEIDGGLPRAGRAAGRGAVLRHHRGRRRRLVRRPAGLVPQRRGRDEVLAAVRGCWASLHTERAVAYRRRHGSPRTRLALAVVVQRLVDADAAGVLFTADPVTGDDSVIVINAGWGLGEAVVGGQVTPDTSPWTAIAGGQPGGQPKIGDDGAHGRWHGDVPVPEDRRSRASLTRRQAEQLAALGVRIEALDARRWTSSGAGTATTSASCRPGRSPRGADVASPWNDSRARRLPVDQHQRRRGDPGRDDPGHLVDGAGVPVRRDGHGVDPALPAARGGSAAGSTSTSA